MTREENENEQKRKYSKCMDYGGTFNLRKYKYKI